MPCSSCHKKLRQECKCWQQKAECSERHKTGVTEEGPGDSKISPQLGVEEASLGGDSNVCPWGRRFLLY